VWQKRVGHGFAGPVVAGGKLILFQRQEQEEVVACFDSAHGAELWRYAYPTSYQDDFGFDDGPRATPCIFDGRVYTFGAQGMLHCLELATGKKLWNKDLKAEFHAENGFFGMACSPLIENDVVLLNLGGKENAGIVALNGINGQVLWKTSEDEASYSSPVSATIRGKACALFLTRSGLVAVDPVNGNIRFQYPWQSRNRMSVNAATPLVIGQTIFLSACYGTGAVLLRPREDEVEKIWSTDDLLSNHYATSVEFNGFLYGIHGRTDPGFSPHPKLRCIELSARRLCWEADAVGAASITRAGSQLLILTEKGALVQAGASPKGFSPNAKAQVLNSEVRAFPALADGFLYARSKDQLICLDLRKSTKDD
jgi:outer membrane protein assembly factor BamB